MKIAFVQLGSFGDCVNSTLMLKPIKDHYGDCKIEVHTTDLYASAFVDNQYVDYIYQHHADSKTKCFNLYNTVPGMVSEMRYDKVFVPAPILHPNKRNSLLHPEFGQNIITTFMRVLEDNQITYDWPVQTILNVSGSEVMNVNRWLAKNMIRWKEHNVLMEVNGESGQTFWDHKWTNEVVKHIMRSDANVFISRRELTNDVKELVLRYKHKVFWVGDLTIRECTVLYNLCDVFISVSSGLSNACCTNHCAKPDGNKRKWYEVINSPTVSSSPLGTDGKVFWYDNDITGFINSLAI